MVIIGCLAGEEIIGLMKPLLCERRLLPCRGGELSFMDPEGRAFDPKCEMCPVPTQPQPNPSKCFFKVVVLVGLPSFASFPHRTFQLFPGCFAQALGNTLECCWHCSVLSFSAVGMGSVQGSPSGDCRFFYAIVKVSPLCPF